MFCKYYSLKLYEQNVIYYKPSFMFVRQILWQPKLRLTH